MFVYTLLATTKRRDTAPRNQARVTGRLFLSLPLFLLVQPHIATAIGSIILAAKMTQENQQKIVTYNVDDAIEKIGFGRFQVILTAVCSLIWLADAMQCITVHILPFLVKCQWELSDVEETIVAMAMGVGEYAALLWGLSADYLGRKKTALLTIAFMVVFGSLSAAKITADDRRVPGLMWLLLCRFRVGIGTVGTSQLTVYYVEFIPRKVRGLCTVFVSGWYSVGSILGVVFALVTMEYLMLGWHWYLAVLVLPLALSLVLLFFLPESARYYLSKGKREKALGVLKKISWFNSTPLPEGELEDDATETSHETPMSDLLDSTSNKFLAEKQQLLGNNIEKKNETFREKILLLFTNGLWKVTAILPALWVGVFILHVGNLILTSKILIHNPHCSYHSQQSSENHSNATSCAAENNLSSQDYLRIIYTTFAELLGLTVILLLIEVIGRRLTLALTLSLTMLGFSLLFICAGQVLLTAFLFLIRAFAFNNVRIMYVYTSEVYPTAVRGLGSGTMSFIGRSGKVIAPFISQMLFSVSDYAAIGTYAGVSLMLAILAVLLPIETKRKFLG